MHGLIGGKHFIEVRDIKDVLGELGLELGYQLFLHKFININVFEPWMANYFLDIVLGSKSLFGVFGQTPINKIFTVIRHGDAVLFGIGEKHWFCSN